MTFDANEWMYLAVVAAGLVFPFLFLYWLVYTAADDVPKDLQDVDKDG